jgi:nitroreductase
MQVKEAIEARRSIREYKPRPIPSKVMDELLESARTAPSSSNLQEWNIIVVTDEATRAKLVPASGNQGFVGQCSAYLVGVVATEYSAIDVSIVLDHISLRAIELGLGTCWIGDFDPAKVKEILGIPQKLLVPICMTLGYPAEAPEATKRRPTGELFYRDKWGSNWS